MQSKSFLIALAAFAVTTTGVHAYSGSRLLNLSDLTEEQREAIIDAEELKATGKVEAAKERLEAAGIDASILSSLKEARDALHNEMILAMQSGDFAAFRAAVDGTPLYDLITTEADFELFVEAHELRVAGEMSEAQIIYSDLGVGTTWSGKDDLATLSEEQRDAYLVAKQANDRNTMQAILDEAGV